MPSLKPSIKQLLILTLIDVIILTIFIIWIDATPDISILEVLVIPGLIFANVVVAIICRLKKSAIYSRSFILNAIIAPVLFHVLFQLWFVYWERKNFDRYNFIKDNKSYEVTLDKRDTSFSISERFDGSSTQYKMGKYEIHKNVIVLLDSGNRIKLSDNKLIGYPKVNDTTNLEK